MVCHKVKLHLIVIYVGYQSAIDSLQQVVESTSNLDSERANTPMGPNGPCSKLIYHDDTVYEVVIGSRFTLMHKGVFLIMQGCTNDSKQGLQIGLID